MVNTIPFNKQQTQKHNNFFRKQMIFLAVFFALVVSSCVPADGAFQCSDDSALLLCLRAQDRVNSLIETANISLPFLALNCTQHVISDDFEWQSALGLSVHYSTKNNANCYRAMELYNGLVRNYSITKYLPIECEYVQGSSSTASFTSCSLFLSALLSLVNQ